MSRVDFAGVSPRQTPGVLVPAYFGPWEVGHWSRLLADRPAIVVINPANGPGSGPSAQYLSLVRRLQESGSTVLMYVRTGYFRRPEPEIALDAANARAWFGVDGMFFDEVPVDDTASVAARLDTLAELSPAYCVFNTGRTVFGDWFDRWPHALFVTFEGSAKQLTERFGNRPDRQVWGPAARQLWLVHSVPAGSRNRYRRLLGDAGLGFGYVTDDVLPNPWDVYVSQSALYAGHRP
jgi:Spherulation-specific family 4